MKVTWNLNGMRNRFAKEYKNKAVEVQTNILLDYAPKMLDKAYLGREFKNDTWNLADSYVWVVYYKGEVKGSGYLWNEKVATTDADFHKTKVNGRRLARNFANTYSPSSDGWEVVWAATAPYASYLEGASSGRFYVITSIYDEVNADFEGNARVSKVINY